MSNTGASAIRNVQSYSVKVKDYGVMRVVHENL